MSEKRDPVASNLPVVQTLVQIQDIPQERKDTFRRSKAVTAVVLRNLRLASMQAQEDYRQLVQKVDAADKVFEQALTTLARKIEKAGRVCVLLHIEDSGAELCCEVESVTVALARNKDNRRYVQTTSIKVKHPESEKSSSYYRDTWEFVRTAKKPNAELLQLRNAFDALCVKKAGLEMRMAELKGDIVKAEKLGDIVEGEEAIANMTVADWEIAESSLASFNKLLSSAGRATMKSAKLLTE
jgi:hypothetical protein